MTHFKGCWRGWQQLNSLKSCVYHAFRTTCRMYQLWFSAEWFAHREVIKWWMTEIIIFRLCVAFIMCLQKKKMNLQVCEKNYLWFRLHNVGCQVLTNCDTKVLLSCSPTTSLLPNNSLSRGVLSKMFPNSWVGLLLLGLNVLGCHITY